MFSIIASPNNLFERHQCEVLSNEGCLTQLANIGWVACDQIATVAQRIGILNAIYGTDIIVSHVGAYWVYTGKTTNELSRSLHVYRSTNQRQGRLPRKKFPEQDLVTIKCVTVTSLERTAIDLLQHDLATGIEALLNLLRQGASYEKIISRVQQLKRVPGMKQVRALLCQLPSDIIDRASSHFAEESEFAQHAEAEHHPSYYP
ncbi:hypothetical protein [Arcanobacterium phocae]|uniref:hypothetical protein n=1 Tax=Arcanobacterium phocae TaxID=131112 RepID=UPI001C120816|nr:hypothetical protein [Arcanobacterium phocae]